MINEFLTCESALNIDVNGPSPRRNARNAVPLAVNHIPCGLHMPMRSPNPAPRPSHRVRRASDARREHSAAYVQPQFQHDMRRSHAPRPPTPRSVSARARARELGARATLPAGRRSARRLRIARTRVPQHNLLHGAAHQFYLPVRATGAADTVLENKPSGRNFSRVAGDAGGTF